MPLDVADDGDALCDCPDEYDCPLEGVLLDIAPLLPAAMAALAKDRTAAATAIS
jgi:hypothetical protein